MHFVYGCLCYLSVTATNAPPKRISKPWDDLRLPIGRLGRYEYEYNNETFIFVAVHVERSTFPIAKLPTASTNRTPVCLDRLLETLSTILPQSWPSTELKL